MRVAVAGKHGVAVKATVDGTFARVAGRRVDATPVVGRRWYVVRVALEGTSLSNDDLWLLGLAMVSIAVVVIGVLFGLVIATLQRIDRHAARTHTVGKQIAQNTVALWALDQMNRDLVAIRDAARGAGRSGIEAGVGAPLSAVADTVQGWIGGSQNDDDKSS